LGQLLQKPLTHLDAVMTLQVLHRPLVRSLPRFLHRDSPRLGGDRQTPDRRLLVQREKKTPRTSRTTIVSSSLPHLPHGRPDAAPFAPSVACDPRSADTKASRSHPLPRHTSFAGISHAMPPSLPSMPSPPPQTPQRPRHLRRHLLHHLQSVFPQRLSQSLLIHFKEPPSFCPALRFAGKIILTHPPTPTT
jgi:hypothetical protein